MPVCPAGSERQPQAPHSIRIDPLFAASLIPPSVAWLLPYLPFMQPFTLDLDNFCSLDPPADPGITGSDLVELVLGFTGGASGAAVSLAVLAGAKVAQLVHVYAWYQLCRCSTAVAPTPFSTPTAPTNPPAINPPGYVQPGDGSGVCRTDNIHLATLDPTTVTAPWITPPAGATGYVIRASGHTTDAISLCNVMQYAADHATFTRYIARFSQDKTTAATAGGPLSAMYAIPPGALGDTVSGTLVDLKDVLITLAPNGASPGVGNPMDIDVSIQWLCPGATTNPCIACPPDPFLSAQLQIIAAQVSALTEVVTLIQRQAVPFAYVAGTSHSGLTGDGELTVADLLGAKVTITDAPAGSIGVDAGTPEFLYSNSWINWGSIDGYGPRVRLEAVTTLSLPDAAGAYTRLAYSLAPGVEITIVELEREP